MEIPWSLTKLWYDYCEIDICLTQFSEIATEECEPEGNTLRAKVCLEICWRFHHHMWSLNY